MNEILDLIDEKHAVIILFRKELNAYVVTVTEHNGRTYTTELDKDEARTAEYDMLEAKIRNGIHVLKLRNEMKW